jgi:acyl carrier protein
MASIDRDGIKRRISETLDIPLEKLADDAPIKEVVTDSFALVEMVVDLQDEFGIQLGHRDLADLTTVGNLADLIVSRARDAA